MARLPDLLLLVAVAALAILHGQAVSRPPAPAAPPASGGSSSICPLTGLPPKKPTIPLVRCPAAKAQSCCDNCTDLSLSLQLVASNIKDVVAEINPIIADGIVSDSPVCDALIGLTPCLQLLEDLMCGLSCNPNAGSYTATSNTGIIMSVCSDFADNVFTQCKGLHLGDMTLSGLVNTADEFMSFIVASVVKTLGVEGFKVQISSSPCFNGTGQYPRYTACCDPLNVPASTCPANITANYGNLIGRSIDSATCQNTTTPTGPTAPPAPASPPPPKAGSPPVSAYFTVLGYLFYVAMALLSPAFL
ncbi:hypothetical protein CLOM_g4676 [Closterium sp. NIES-68]|nr:hypothetical protein CLOM_g4676 [Closterium sp. NIES-68]